MALTKWGSSNTKLGASPSWTTEVTLSCGEDSYQKLLASRMEAGAFTGRYVAHRVLGEGGMGRVSLARDHVLNREIALKELQPRHRSDESFRTRFLREARIQSRLEHPSIVPVYDLLKDHEGNEFFVMKRVVGATLEETLRALAADPRMRTEAFQRRRILSAFINVCLAVHYAHTKGVVHRDLKPSNIMLGEFGEVYVMDWGIAKVMGESEDSIAEIAVVVASEDSDGATEEATEEGTEQEGGRTKAGQLLGTPGYMAPEQAMGAVGHHGPHTDVYALGAILFEIVTLEPLYPGEEPSQLRRATLQGVEARLSVRAPDRQLPAMLEALWLQALEQDPRSRALTARDLAEGVEHYLDGDRHFERSRAMAHSLAQQAAEFEARAQMDNLEGRTDALRWGAKALALDPEQTIAVRTIVTMLENPPKLLPEEVQKTLDDREVDEGRMAMRLAGYGYIVSLFVVAVIFCWLPAVSFEFVPTVDWTLVAVSFCSVGVAMVRQSRREKPLGPTVWLPLVLILVSILLTARADVAYSPAGIVHACAAVFMTSMVAGEILRKQLYTFVLLVAVAVIVRPVLEVVGASAPTVFLGDDLRTLSFRSSMPLPSIAYVHTLFIALFFAAVLYTAVLGRVMRFVIVRGRRQLYLLLWQLHQILPNAKLRLGSIRPTGPGDPRSLIERLLQ